MRIELQLNLFEEDYRFERIFRGNGDMAGTGITNEYVIKDRVTGVLLFTNDQ